MNEELSASSRGLQAAVIGSPDELRGSVIKAYIVLAENCVPPKKWKDSVTGRSSSLSSGV